MTATSNVVRLPTAPKRKVQQNHNRAARAEREKLPRHPAERLFPGQREALKLAAELGKVDQTPGLMLALMMFQAQPLEVRGAVAPQIAAAAAQGHGYAREIATALRLTTLNFGQQCDFEWACRRLRGEA